MRHHIEFTVTNLRKNTSYPLRGWLYYPQHQTTPAPAIIMSHGFSALKEHYLAHFAEVFVNAGFCVLIYDNSHFGESGGLPRLEVDPLQQIADMRSAITFIQTIPQVDANKIGLWGTSLSAGNVLSVAAEDKRISCAVAQVPFVKSPYKSRHQHHMPPMIPVVSEDPSQFAIMKQAGAYAFFTSVTGWQNAVTAQSVENCSRYEPIAVIANITIPVLFIVADQDTVTKTDLALLAYHKMTAPKKLVMIEGEHFAPYVEQFEVSVEAAGGWFKKYMLDLKRQK